MKHKNLMAGATALICFCSLPAMAVGQGKGKSGGNDKAVPAKAADHEARKAAQGQDKGRPDDAAKPAKSNRGNERQDNRVSSGKVRGGDVNKGQRGVEQRSDRANEVANGPNPAAARGNAKLQFLSAKDVRRYNRDLRNDQVNPRIREFIASNRASDLLAGGALAYAMARGIPPEALRLTRGGNLVEAKNRKGNLLFALRDDDARSLGAWRVAPLDDNTGKGAPSFCRSGAGHPVWGRQWCIDKGFGLGATGNIRWGRTRDVSDMRWNGDLGTGSLTRDALIAVLGPTAFNRLALHAVTLGLVEPLAGQWRTDNSGQRLLLVSSGVAPVAEFADFNNDRLVDLMLVALRGW